MKFNKPAVPFLKASGLCVSSVHPRLLRAFLPSSLSAPLLFSFISGSSLSSKTEKELRFMLEEIKVNDHWLIFIFCGCGWRSNQCRWPCQLGVFLCHQENKASAGIELPQLFQG